MFILFFSSKKSNFEAALRSRGEDERCCFQKDVAEAKRAFAAIHRRISFLQDNVTSNKAKSTMKAREKKFTVIDQYSPDLSPPDFWYFKRISNQLEPKK